MNSETTARKLREQGYYEQDEQGLRTLRFLADQCLRDYVEEGSKPDCTPEVKHAWEMRWHLAQRDFYEAVNQFNYSYGEVPAWVAEVGLRLSEDGTP